MQRHSMHTAVPLQFLQPRSKQELGLPWSAECHGLAGRSTQLHTSTQGHSIPRWLARLLGIDWTERFS